MMTIRFIDFEQQGRKEKQVKKSDEQFMSNSLKKKEYLVNC